MINEPHLAQIIKDNLDKKIKETNGSIKSLNLRISAIPELQKIDIEVLKQHANQLGYKLEYANQSPYKKLFRKYGSETIIAFYEEYRP